MNAIGTCSLPNPYSCLRVSLSASTAIVQTPSSRRTTCTPATMFFSFCLAAQRAVWLRPQSGAKASRSAGACFRHSRTRSATSSTFRCNSSSHR